MDSQMELLKGNEGRRRRPQKLDAHTRARGLAGVAEARKALEQTHPPEPVPLRRAS